MITTGLVLAPDDEWLDLARPLLDGLCTHVEIAPETTWYVDAEGGLRPNGFHDAFARIAVEGGQRVVAHGVGFSLGSASASDAPRRERWLARLREDRRVFGYEWYTEHLGQTTLDGLAITLPLPLPMNDASAEAVRRSLGMMASVVPDVGVENNVAYCVVGRPLDEPAFLARVLEAPRTHLLLDLHNLLTMATNHRFDPVDYLERLDLARVIEIHLSGGRISPGEWLPSGRSLRLDSHDDAIPDEVWSLFERVLPKAANLRGVTIERLEGTVSSSDVPLLAEELRRARRMVELAR